MNIFRFSFKKYWLLVVIFLLGLVYVVLPGPESIYDIPAVPYSLKSIQEGDTFQNKNIAAYYTNFRRAFLTFFYKRSFENSFHKTYFENRLIPNLPIPVITLNHPPELAGVYVRDQQESTFLEEYTRPLRESLFVNGYEPLIENYMRRVQADKLGNNNIYKGELYATKATVRYYSTLAIFRILVYLGIWIAGIYLYKLFTRVQKEY